MYIPYGMGVRFAVLGAVVTNVCGLTAAALSLRPVQAVGISTYTRLFMHGMPAWTVLGLVTGIGLLYAARTLEDTYAFDHVGFSFIRKNGFYVGLLAWGICIPIRWLLTTPGALEPRSLLACLAISYVL